MDYDNSNNYNDSIKSDNSDDEHSVITDGSNNEDGDISTFLESSLLHEKSFVEEEEMNEDTDLDLGSRELEENLSIDSLGSISEDISNGTSEDEQNGKDETSRLPMLKEILERQRQFNERQNNLKIRHEVLQEDLRKAESGFPVCDKTDSAPGIVPPQSSTGTSSIQQEDSQVREVSTNSEYQPAQTQNECEYNTLAEEEEEEFPISTVPVPIKRTIIPAAMSPQLPIPETIVEPSSQLIGDSAQQENTTIDETSPATDVMGTSELPPRPLSSTRRMEWLRKLKKEIAEEVCEERNNVEYDEKSEMSIGTSLQKPQQQPEQQPQQQPQQQEQEQQEPQQPLEEDIVTKEQTDEKEMLLPKSNKSFNLDNISGIQKNQQQQQQQQQDQDEETKLLNDSMHSMNDTTLLSVSSLPNSNSPSLASSFSSDRNNTKSVWEKIDKQIQKRKSHYFEQQQQEEEGHNDGNNTGISNHNSIISDLSTSSFDSELQSFLKGGTSQLPSRTFLPAHRLKREIGTVDNISISMSDVSLNEIQKKRDNVVDNQVLNDNSSLNLNGTMNSSTMSSLFDSADINDLKTKAVQRAKLNPHKVKFSGSVLERKRIARILTGGIDSDYDDLSDDDDFSFVL
eukprot:TRINITY_DN2535_c0_g3_i1.p1 TRINITY_DN2535_c0_g3~~TRINITY_DN2535_c0_g3_i1.p1  ORF type:complete len:724 (+),score=274.14 TRINITY_DN2535_c0_g3_i1:300-2174(+)